MALSRFHLPGMDCAADEELVRMRLDGVAGVDGVTIDSVSRTVAVAHRTGMAVVVEALDELGMRADLVADDAEPTASELPAAGERFALVAALAINAVFFAVEAVAGLVARSMGLVADSLDMLADAGVYALSLAAVGGPAARKRRLARGSGYVQLGLAVGGIVEVGRRFLIEGAPPEVATMVVVAALALLANILTLLLLRRARSPEAHFQASWIFTANDVKVNALVIVAAVAVAVVDHPGPDLVAGALIFLIVAGGARRILALAR